MKKPTRRDYSYRELSQQDAGKVVWLVDSATRTSWFKVMIHTVNGTNFKAVCFEDAAVVDTGGLCSNWLVATSADNGATPLTGKTPEVTKIPTQECIKKLLYAIQRVAQRLAWDPTLNAYVLFRRELVNNVRGIVQPDADGYRRLSLLMADTSRPGSPEEFQHFNRLLSAIPHIVTALDHGELDDVAPETGPNIANIINRAYEYVGVPYRMHAQGHKDVGTMAHTRCVKVHDLVQEGRTDTVIELWV